MYPGPQFCSKSFIECIVSQECVKQQLLIWYHWIQCCMWWVIDWYLEARFYNRSVLISIVESDFIIDQLIIIGIDSEIDCTAIAGLDFIIDYFLKFITKRAMNLSNFIFLSIRMSWRESKTARNNDGDYYRSWISRNYTMRVQF